MRWTPPPLLPPPLDSVLCSLTCCLAWDQLRSRRQPPPHPPIIPSLGSLRLCGMDPGLTRAAVRIFISYLALLVVNILKFLRFWISSCLCVCCDCWSGYDDGEVETFSSGGGGGHAGAYSPARGGGIDMNQLPSTTECDEEAVVSSSPSSCIGMKRDREKNMLEQHDQLFEQLLDRERACDLSSRGCSDDEDAGGGGTTRKKLRLSKEQSALLEESFKDHSTLNPVWTRMSDSLLLPLSWFLSRVFPLGHCRFCTISSAAYLWWYLCGWLPSAEAEERLGKATKLATSTSGSLVPKQKSKVCTFL